MNERNYRLLKANEIIKVGDELASCYASNQHWVTINPKSMAIGNTAGRYSSSSFRRKESMKSKIVRAF